MTLQSPEISITAEQEDLRQVIIKACQKLRAMYEARTLPKLPMESEGFLLGTLVQPAHTIEGGTISIPERSYTVRYVPNYGCVCQRLCSSNGSAWWLAACVRGDTQWVPADGELRW